MQHAISDAIRSHLFRDAKQMAFHQAKGSLVSQKTRQNGSCRYAIPPLDYCDSLQCLDTDDVSPRLLIEIKKEFHQILSAAFVTFIAQVLRDSDDMPADATSHHEGMSSDCNSSIFIFRISGGDRQVFCFFILPVFRGMHYPPTTFTHQPNLTVIQESEIESSVTSETRGRINLFGEHLILPFPCLAAYLPSFREFTDRKSTQVNHADFYHPVSQNTAACPAPQKVCNPPTVSDITEAYVWFVC